MGGTRPPRPLRELRPWASMLASLTGAQNRHVTNVTSNEPTSDIEHANELSPTNYPLATAPPPPRYTKSGHFF